VTLAGGERLTRVLILLYMCPHTALYVSSYCYICYACPQIPGPPFLRPHTLVGRLKILVYEAFRYVICVLRYLGRLEDDGAHLAQQRLKTRAHATSAFRLVSICTFVAVKRVN